MNLGDTISSVMGLAEKKVVWARVRCRAWSSSRAILSFNLLAFSTIIFRIKFSHQVHFHVMLAQSGEGALALFDGTSSLSCKKEGGVS